MPGYNRVTCTLVTAWRAEVVSVVDKQGFGLTDDGSYEETVAPCRRCGTAKGKLLGLLESLLPLAPVLSAGRVIG